MFRPKCYLVATVTHSTETLARQEEEEEGKGGGGQHGMPRAKKIFPRANQSSIIYSNSNSVVFGVKSVSYFKHGKYRIT